MTKLEREHRAACDHLEDTEWLLAKAVENPHYHPDMIAAKKRYEETLMALMAALDKA